MNNSGKRLRALLPPIVFAALLLFPCILEAQNAPANLPNLNLFDASYVTAMVLQEDGKVIVGGGFPFVNGASLPSRGIVRLNPNGTLDLTWNPQARNSSFPSSLALDGTNLYVGQNYQISKVDALTGDADANWNPNFNIYGSVSSIAVTDTNIYIAGYFTTDSPFGINFLARSDKHGNLDTNWIPNPSGQVNKIIVNGNSAYVVGAFTNIGGSFRNTVAKISTGGRGLVDTNWNPQISTYYPFSRDIGLVGTNLFVSSDGIFSVNGTARQYFLKLDALNAGALDVNWNPSAYAPGVQSGKIIINNGYLYFQAQKTNYLGAYGYYDIFRTPLDGLGQVDTNWSLTLVGGITAAVSSDSSLIIGGGFSHCNGDIQLSIAKIDAHTGTRDSSFNTQLENAGQVKAIVKTPDGKVIVGGDFWFAQDLPRQGLARVNVDGTLDTTWHPDPDGGVNSLCLAQNSLFVGGGFLSIGGLPKQNMAKVSLLNSDAVDPNWTATNTSYWGVQAIVISGTNLFYAGGNFGLEKLDINTGNSDTSWHVANSGGSSGIACLATDNTNLFIGGYFQNVNGINLTNLAKISIDSPATVDTNWQANTPIYQAGNLNGYIHSLALSGTNLYVGGGFLQIGGVARHCVAKVSTTDPALIDSNWNPTDGLLNDEFHVVISMALDLGGTNLYLGFNSGLERRDALMTGLLDTNFSPHAIISDPFCYSLATSGKSVYVGGQISGFSDMNRNGFAFFAVAEAPILFLNGSNSMVITPNQNNGPEISHFRITGINGVSLFMNDGVTPVNTNDFITVAQGAAGLKIVGTNGSVSAVSAVNNTPDGAGIASATLNLNINVGGGGVASPFVFSLTTNSYSLNEGSSLSVAVRKIGTGAGTVSYTTVNGTATGGYDYQPRSGTLNFGPSETLKYLPSIAIVRNYVYLGDRYFSVALNNVSSGSVLGSPASATVNIIDNNGIASSDSVLTNAPTSVAGVPVANGALTITLQPTNALGQWRLVGSLNWQDSGTLVSGLVNGNYTVEFRPLNGYYQPDTQVIPIVAGQTNPFTFYYTATTNLDTGNLTATIEPDDVATNTDVNARGQWRRQGEVNWHNSGDAVPSLNAGSYTVEYKAVTNRLAPTPQIVQVGGGNANYGYTATYLVAPPTAGAVTPVVVPFNTATTNAPYLYNGQLQTSVGFASGAVVKPRVVLTVAHALFDDVLLRYVTTVRWFFERYRDQLEPVPQIPRGWYIFDGYAGQRALDNSPGISTPASQNLDAAALYFLEDAGRGSYGGYFSSDADNNEYLTSPNNQFLAGYPLAGIAVTDQGKLFATKPTNIVFTKAHDQVYVTTQLASYPGNSGGPLYVQNYDGVYYPAGIYLGGSGETLVRAIDSQVVDLINRADISGNGGGNSTGGGVTTLSPGLTTTAFGTGLLTVNMTPNQANFHPGWRIKGGTDTNYITTLSTTTSLIGGGGYPIEFKAVSGFITPSNRTVQVAVNQTALIQADYAPIRPVLSFKSPSTLSFTGVTNAIYRVEYATNLSGNVNWFPLATQTVTVGSVTLNLGPATNKVRFFRTVQLQ